MRKVQERKKEGDKDVSPESVFIINEIDRWLAVNDKRGINSYVSICLLPEYYDEFAVGEFFSRIL